MNGGELRKQALRKLHGTWCSWWYGASGSVNGELLQPTKRQGKSSADAVCAEYCVEGDGHISAFLTRAVTDEDASAIAEEISAVLSGSGIELLDTMVFAALPESLARIVREVIKESSGTGRTPANHGPFRMWVVDDGRGSKRPEELQPAAAAAAAATTPATADTASAVTTAAGIPTTTTTTTISNAYRIQPLAKANAGVVNEAWPYKSPWSPAMVAQCIAERPSSCAVSLATGEPVAWAVARNDGSIGLLHTEPEHRKQGLAKAVVTDLVAKLRAEGFAEPYFYVSKGNEGSEKVCSALGFSPMAGEGYVWLSYKT